MQISKEFKEMVDADIRRISESTSLPYPEKMKLHRELDGRYQACIRDWHNGLWGTDTTATRIHYVLLENDPREIQENLDMMKAKLESFWHGVNAVQTTEPPSTQVNVTTNVNVAITFDQAREKIEDMTALSREQTDEILEKIDELEKISKENTSRKTKWEKVKPIIAFALDKGADVAIAILSLVMQMKLGM